MLATLFDAGVAQLVEHHLAKVAVESSNLFARSIFNRPKMDFLQSLWRIFCIEKQFAALA